MPLDRETVYQVLVSAGAVSLFVGAAVVVTDVYGTNGGMTAEGGFALVGAVVLFIFLMAVAGLWLERQDFDGEGA